MSRLKQSLWHHTPTRKCGSGRSSRGGKKEQRLVSGKLYHLIDIQECDSDAEAPDWVWLGVAPSRTLAIVGSGHKIVLVLSKAQRKLLHLASSESVNLWMRRLFWISLCAKLFLLSPLVTICAFHLYSECGPCCLARSLSLTSHEHSAAHNGSLVIGWHFCFSKLPNTHAVSGGLSVLLRRTCGINRYHLHPFLQEVLLSPVASAHECQPSSERHASPSTPFAHHYPLLVIGDRHHQ